MGTIRLDSLPVELLYEIQLLALSEALPNTSKYFRDVFRASTPAFRAHYILGRTSQEVLDIFRHSYHRTPSPELPRRLFRSLTPKESSMHGASPKWMDREQPLPYLKYLYDTPGIPSPDVNSHDGYALTKAVHAGFIPLIRFLLAKGASPKCKNGLAVMVAIRRKDLSMVRMLIERPKEPTKRRKLEDRMQVTSEMLKMAVKWQAWDIAEYLTAEKGCVPDMQTLRLMH